jgi:multidrug efflux pump subunit AcrB
VDVDRTRGVTMRDVTSSLVANLAGSSQVAPTFWLNPQNGVQYPIVVQTPQYRLDTLAALAQPPVGGSNGDSQVLGAFANFTRTSGNALVSQYDIQPMVQIYATTQGRDLGAVATELRRILADSASEVPKGSTVLLLGQVRTMENAFSGLLFGLLGAIVLIYFLIVVNFQSWTDPFVIITALPAALAGIVWMLFVTHTPISAGAYRGDHVHGCGDRK